MEDAKVRMNIADILGMSYEEYYEPSFRRMLGIDEAEGVVLNNKSKMISDSEIEGVIDLLHPVYKELDILIKIYGSRFRTLLEWVRPFNCPEKRKMFSTAYKGRLYGSYGYRGVHLFPYNYETRIKKHRSECLKLLTVASLFHEIRHAFQEEYKKKEWNKEDETYIRGGEGYHSQWSERDANKFSQRMMNNNKDEISKILNIQFEWDCVWGNFNVDF